MICPACKHKIEENDPVREVMSIPHHDWCANQAFRRAEAVIKRLLEKVS